MAIDTLDKAATGARPPYSFFKNTGTMEAAGQTHSLLYASGFPGPGVAPSPGLSGAALTSYSGQIPFANPAPGKEQRLYGLAINATQALGAILLDRLWHNSGIVVTTTTAQTVNSVTLPARDSNGATAGEGVLAALEVSTATTNASAVTTISISYTNSSGVSGRTGTIASFPATAVAGTIVFFQLQAGDVGVQSIQSITLGTSLGAGAVHLVLARPLASAFVAVANGGSTLDFISCGGPKLYDNTVPFFVLQPAGTAGTFFFATLTTTQEP